VLGEHQNGLDVNAHHDLGPASAEGTLHLKLRVGAGHILVTS
jgi:hypothetical protein